MNRRDSKRINVTLRRVSLNTVAEQKYAQRMRHIGLPSVACLDVQHFSTSTHKQRNIRKKKYLT